MGCTGCSVGGGCGSGGGCSGGCKTGGCNRMNTFDWLSQLDIADTDPFDFIEVSFKNGARKAFFRSGAHYRPTPTEMVVVDVGGGFDIGRVNLSGELVRLQMKKRRINPDNVLQEVVRKANERDLERLQEAREMEQPTMVQARAIARSLGLDMKIGDVEFQGDKRKATFYYTANGRVDFRELIRQYAKEFRVKIEMRQIGARQESARIGGLGSCGRELCCTTWLRDFDPVSIKMAKEQEQQSKSFTADESINHLSVLFVNTIGVSDGYIEFCPDNEPPLKGEIISWIWTFRPDLGFEILNQNIEQDLRLLIGSYANGTMDKWWNDIS